jgi:ubiquinone/menaquinone biosynthesis C-methylase UbiE
MRPRLSIGRFLIRLGDFIKSMSVVVMRPDDLLELTRRTYAEPESLGMWSRPDLLQGGLKSDERELLQRLPVRTGRLLLLGVGGGREVVPLAQAGFEVTGVDMIPEMVARARRHAESAGVRMEGLVQDIAALDVPAVSYEVVWFSPAMYSCIPTRRRRVAMLRRMHEALREGGYLVCQFHWDPSMAHGRWADRLRRMAAWLVLGNVRYESGDVLWGGREFLHVFCSADSIKNEFGAGGFETGHLCLPDDGVIGGAVLRKMNRDRALQPGKTRRG